MQIIIDALASIEEWQENTKTYGRFEAGLLASKLEKDDVPRGSSESKEPIFRAHGQLFDSQMLLARFGHHACQITVRSKGSFVTGRSGFIKDFARLETVKYLESKR